MEEEKAAADKPESSAVADKWWESSSEEAVDEIESDSNEATETEIGIGILKSLISRQIKRKKFDLKEFDERIGLTHRSESSKEATASGAAEEDKPHGRRAGIRSGLFLFFTNPPNVIKHIRIPLLIVVIAGAVFMLTLFITEFVGFVWLLSLLTSFSILWIMSRMILPWWIAPYSLPYGSLPYWCVVTAIAHHMQSPAIGMFVVQLSPHFAAGFLGYALAQHNMIIQRGPVLPMSDNEDGVERLRVLKISAGLIHALLNLGVTLRLAWVLSHSGDYTPVDFMMHFLLPLIGGLLLWITFIAVALGDAFMGDDGLTLVVFYFLFIMLNYILMVVTLGHTVATLATWFAVLGLSGFLGYSIRIYKSPRVTKDLGLQASSVHSSRPDSSS